MIGTPAKFSPKRLDRSGIFRFVPFPTSGFTYRLYMTGAAGRITFYNEAAAEPWHITRAVLC